MRIYRHALESIFAMLNLQDLSRALAVSREWSAAVRSMKPIGASFVRDEWRLGMDNEALGLFPPVDSLVASPLIRHLSTLTLMPAHEPPMSPPLTRTSLALLSQHAPNLTSLHCSLAAAPAATWILPASLTSLQFECSGLLSAADTNALFVRVSALTALNRLWLGLPDDYAAAGVDFSLLAAAPSLTSLTFRNAGLGHPLLGHDQVDQIRTTLGHLRALSVARMNSFALTRFLQPPVTARWQDINQVWLDARAESLLLTLPSQTRLNLYLGVTRPHVDFLSQLPQLTSLDLMNERREEEDGEGEGERFCVPPAALLKSLLPCAGLTQLNLDCGFNSAQLAALFSKLTSLTVLTIRGDLESLECFATGPITQSLEELSIVLLALPPSELVHLYALKRLRSLRIHRCFSRPLDAATLDSLSPPTALFPQLTSFFCVWIAPDRKRNSVSRTGCSFEWTQQRLLR